MFVIVCVHLRTFLVGRPSHLWCVCRALAPLRRVNTYTFTANTHTHTQSSKACMFKIEGRLAFRGCALISLSPPETRGKVSRACGGRAACGHTPELWPRCLDGDQPRRLRRGRGRAQKGSRVVGRNGENRAWVINQQPQTEIKTYITGCSVSVRQTTSI